MTSRRRPPLPLRPLGLFKRPSALIDSEVAARQAVHTEAGVWEVRVRHLICHSHISINRLFIAIVSQTRTERAVSFSTLAKFQKHIITVGVP